MPLSTRMRIIAAKAETNAGEPVAINNADTLFYGYDGGIVNNVAFNAMGAAGTLSLRPAQPGEESGQHTFTTEFMLDAPWSTILMPSLGWTNTGSAWSPTDNTALWSWLTSGQNEAGRLKKISGAMSSAVITLPAGGIPTVAWTLMGRYEAEANATQWTPAFTVASQHAGLRLGSSVTTLANTAISIATATLSIKNEVSLVMDTNASGGIAYAWIGSRAIELVIDPLEELARGDDAAQRAKTIQAFSMAWGSMSVSVPYAQIQPIAPGDRNGLSARSLTMIATTNGTAGDECVINFNTVA